MTPAERAQNASANPPTDDAGSAPQDPHGGQAGHVGADDEDEGYDEFTTEEHLTEPVTYVRPTRVIDEPARPDAGTPEDVRPTFDEVCLRAARAATNTLGLPTDPRYDATVADMAALPDFRAAIHAGREPLIDELADALAEYQAAIQRAEAERDEARRQLAEVRTYANECTDDAERDADDLAGAQRGITGRHLLRLLNATPTTEAAP